MSKLKHGDAIPPRSMPGPREDWMSNKRAWQRLEDQRRRIVIEQAAILEEQVKLEEPYCARCKI